MRRGAHGSIASPSEGRCGKTCDAVLHGVVRHGGSGCGVLCCVCCGSVVLRAGAGLTGCRAVSWDVKVCAVGCRIVSSGQVVTILPCCAHLWLPCFLLPLQTNV